MPVNKSALKREQAAGRAILKAIKAKQKADELRWDAEDAVRKMKDGEWVSLYGQTITNETQLLSTGLFAEA
jgi:hypothetical protein